MTSRIVGLASGSIWTGTVTLTGRSGAYDGNQIVVQFEKDGDGALAGNDLSHRYLWQPDAVDQLMADEQLTGGRYGYDPTAPGNVVLPLADHLGTVRDLATFDSATGTTTVANHRVYDSYGDLKSQTNAAVDCLFGFTGQPFDKTTGLQNNGAERWYDSVVGRWMSKDPIGFLGRDANPYRYYGNNSVMYVDPSGEAWYDYWPISWFYTPQTPRRPVPGVLNPGDRFNSEFQQHPGGFVPKTTIALGLDSALDAFAKTHSASKILQTVKNPMEWKGEFFDLMKNTNVEVVVNLTGIDVWAGISRAAWRWRGD